MFCDISSNLNVEYNKKKLSLLPYKYSNFPTFIKISAKFPPLHCKISTRSMQPIKIHGWTVYALGTLKSNCAEQVERGVPPQSDMRFFFERKNVYMNYFIHIRKYTSIWIDSFAGTLIVGRSKYDFLFFFILLWIFCAFDTLKTERAVVVVFSAHKTKTMMRRGLWWKMCHEMTRRATEVGPFIQRARGVCNCAMRWK